MPLQPARLEFTPDGTPFSSAFGDVYHSTHGGPAQARHVFLGGNDLPVRWQDRERFVILETGFGLGLNFLATWQAWRADTRRCRRLHFISIEKHPFTAPDLAVAQQAWPEFADLAAILRQHYFAGSARKRCRRHRHQYRLRYPRRPPGQRPVK
jgi:tRNA 5-methylaminomethyl-2-thiouridine biosynthesis bifunctional protein